MFNNKYAPKLVFFIENKNSERFEWFLWIHFESQILTLFDDQSVDELTKYIDFIWMQLIFGQKPCFLGPRQLARQKVNMHYYTSSKVFAPYVETPHPFHA